MSKSAAANSEWRGEFKKTLGTYLLKGDYAGALPLVKRALKKYPDEFIVRFNYAKILGDWADELPAGRKTKLKAEAIRILKPLLRSMAGIEPLERFGVSLNYYYQSEAWRPMYRFGRRFERFHKQKALYAQGLAATLLAYDELQAKRLKSASTWADRAVAAWNKYDFKKEKYYFPHYCFAKALAIQSVTSNSGKATSNQSRKVLERAARLGQRSVTDWEFADVLNLLT